MAKHHSPYGTAAKLERFFAACGPNKLLGTGETVVKAFRILAAQERNHGYPIEDMMETLEAGIKLSLDDSFMKREETDESA